jgi:hypothetical protein
MTLGTLHRSNGAALEEHDGLGLERALVRKAITLERVEIVFGEELRRNQSLRRLSPDPARDVAEQLRRSRDFGQRLDLHLRAAVAIAAVGAAHLEDARRGRRRAAGPHQTSSRPTGEIRKPDGV